MFVTHLLPPYNQTYNTIMVPIAAISGGTTVRPLFLPPSSRLNRPTPLFSPFARSPSSLSQFPSLPLHSSRTIRAPVVAAAQSNFGKVVQTAYRIGKDVIETGTSFVPIQVEMDEAVFRKQYQDQLRGLTMVGLIYFAFIAFNSDEGSGRSGGPGGNKTTSSEDPVEEARRIMEKYK